MSQIILGAIALLGVLWLLKSYTKASPSAMSRMLKMGGGILAITAGVVLFLRGRFDIAFPLVILGLGLTGWHPNMPGFPGLPGGRSHKSPGQVSRVRSAMLEMELEHDTGVMRGTVLVGRFQGRRLDDLSPDELKRLFVEVSADPDGRSLFEAYLDRRLSGWREHFQQDAAAGAGQRTRSSNAMTKEEAHQILGVKPGASVDEIRAAHRALMKKLHPDQGGSTYLAARVNEAKEVLLSGHG
ncbi:MAG: DnaJ domain-containing protein [Labrys sp. (in: a-proteobacteria)]